MSLASKGGVTLAVRTAVRTVGVFDGRFDGRPDRQGDPSFSLLACSFDACNVGHICALFNEDLVQNRTAML